MTKKCTDETHRKTHAGCATCKNEGKKARRALHSQGIATPRQSATWGAPIVAFKKAKIAEHPYCAMCGATEHLVVDHDHDICPARSHACEKCFRDVLCRVCNMLRDLG